MSDLKWLLLDYGSVLCVSQTEDDLRAMAAVLGVDWQDFTRGYWADRAEYDRADVPTEAYWSRVVGRELDKVAVDEINGMDVAGWSRPNREFVDACWRIAQILPLSLLSNAPKLIADEIRTLDWMPPMEHLIFSCDLHLTKPDPEIYARALRILEAEPGSVLFVDDRMENIVAATDAGIHAIPFTGNDAIPAILAAIHELSGP